MEMIPTQHEKDEWSRMAQTAYAARRNDAGHKFSVAASTPNGTAVSLQYFDALQSEYRAWLCFDEYPTMDENL